MAFIMEDSGDGKGEKVVQETTSRRVIVGLFRLEAASSRIPLSEGCPPEAFWTRWRVECLRRWVTGVVDK